jgi:hypothetical protein
MTRALALLTLCLLPGLVACSSDDDDDVDTDALTLVAVDSADFPSAANCGVPEDSTSPRGAYVAELIDVSGAVSEAGLVKLDDFIVQSSAPVLCGKTLGFSQVTAERAYEIAVRVYPDIDGDPTTLDICTKGNTSVTVTRVDGKCTDELATPSSTFHCYGWSKQSDGTESSLDAPDGEPVLAIEYRTAMAHYCTE